MGYNSVKNNPDGPGGNTVTTTWAFSPEAGTFLKDDIQLGLALGLSGGKTRFDGDDEAKFTAINPTVYGRKFFKITDNFSTFAGVYLHLVNETETDYGVTTVETKGSGFGANVGVGVAYALSPKFTAVGQFGVFGFETVKNKVDGDDVDKDSTFGFGVNTVGGSVFNVGIYYTFKQ